MVIWVRFGFLLGEVGLEASESLAGGTCLLLFKVIPPSATAYQQPPAPCKV